ncbi:MAG TPA: AAA family ATPase [Solirubrobacterales bacterium]|nr:AAA family ATPase [Solirubrobacterales bacterium]
MTGPSPVATSAPVDDPYVGLANFTEEDAEWFFGRESESAVVIGNLRAARLTLLYAESGVGKSSVLRAGVVASLRQHGERERQARGAPRLLPVIFSTWSGRPIRSLVDAIAAAAQPYWPEGATPELDGDDLEAAIRAVAEKLDTTPLLILDQFEEHFLYPEQAEEGERVADQVARCVNDPHLRANFLISIREDAYSHVGDLFRGKIANVYGNFLHLDFLDRAGARKAIEGPIAHVNELDPDAEPFAVEPQLVEAVLTQVGRDANGEEGGGVARVETTYLQLVMRRLWEVETAAGSRLLRLATLEELGGAQTIIGGHLDRAMDDSIDGAGGLTQAQRLLAAAIFHFLVTSGGTKIALSAQDLADLTEVAKVELEPVLRHLSSPKLHILRPISSRGGGEPLYEIFHDALARPIVEWRGRVEEGQRDERLRREREEKEEALREAQKAERRAASERRRKRIALALLGVAVAVMVIAAVVFAFYKAGVANRRKAATESVEVAQRLFSLSTSPTFGPSATALAALEADRLSPTFEARSATLGPLQLNPALPTIAVGHTRTSYAVAFWPESKRLVSGGGDGTIRFWNLHGEQLGPPLVLSGKAIYGVAIAGPPGRRLLAAGFTAGPVRLWRVDDPEHLVGLGTLPGVAGANRALVFDPRDPSLLAVGGQQDEVMLWDLSDPRNPVLLGKRTVAGGIWGLAFSSDGSRLLAATEIGRFAWRVAADGFAPGAPATYGRAPSTAVATAADGAFAFGGGRGVDVRDASGRLLQLRPPGPSLGLAFADGGKALAVASSDSTVTTWDVGTGRPFGPPRIEGRSPVTSLAVSPDGETLATTGEDALVKLWDVDPGRTLATTIGGLDPAESRLEAEAGFWALAVSGNRVATADGAAGTSIWDLGDLPAAPSAPHPSTTIPGPSYAVAFHRNLLALGRGNSFVLMDTGPDCATMPRRPCQLGPPAHNLSRLPVESLAMSEEEGRVLLASTAHRRGHDVIDLWDVTRTARTRRIRHLSARPSRVPGARFYQVALGPPGTPLLAVAASDGKTRVWDVSDPYHPRGITFESAYGNENQAGEAIAFSPDGSLLATGGRDQQVALWEVAHDDDGYSVEPTASTLYQSQPITALAFSGDGETLAAGDGNGSICLYDVPTRQLVGVCLPGHLLGRQRTYVRGLAFTAEEDGASRLVSAGFGQPITMWDSILWDRDSDSATGEELKRDVCAMAGRNLTETEWEAVFDTVPMLRSYRETCAD